MACFSDCSLCVVLNLDLFSSYFSRNEVVEMEHKSSTGKFLSLKVFIMIFLRENHLLSKSAAYVAGLNSAQLYLSPPQRIFPYCVMAEVLWQCCTLSASYSTRLLQFCGFLKVIFERFELDLQLHSPQRS